MQPDTALSAHFHLSEFTHSQTATRLGLRNEPLAPQVANLKRLVQVLEAARIALGHNELLISSGFRSPALNIAVGGAHTPPSAHLDGRAADFIAPAFGNPRAVCQRLIDAGLAFDQLVCEGTWVHLAIATLNAEPRREVLTAFFSVGRARPSYARGLV